MQLINDNILFEALLFFIGLFLWGIVEVIRFFKRKGRNRGKMR